MELPSYGYSVIYPVGSRFAFDKTQFSWQPTTFHLVLTQAILFLFSWLYKYPAMYIMHIHALRNRKFLRGLGFSLFVWLGGGAWRNSQQSHRSEEMTRLSGSMQVKWKATPASFIESLLKWNFLFCNYPKYYWIGWPLNTIIFEGD